jgi:vanillate O-demethylase monooxygenase subunit
MSAFLRNQWYTAATSAEIGDKPLARTICNEPLVIFRSGNGNVAVLTDRCPHRKAPLSSGEVVGNDIQCGYHGIRFAPDGACTRVPGNAQIGRNFRARSFPAHEVHGLIFVWLGEAALADPAHIPDFSENVKPGWTGVHGMLYVKGNYQLLIDNILDLTHVVFVHKTTLAGGGVAETPLDVEIDGDVVRAQRLMRNVDTAPIYKAARNLHGKIDRWQFLRRSMPGSHSVPAKPAARFRLARRRISCSTASRLKRSAPPTISGRRCVLGGSTTPTCRRSIRT